MKYLMKLFLLTTVLHTCTNTKSQESKNAFNDYSDLITPSLLSKHLYYLASDEMKGRETGTEEQKHAAKYLAEQYSQLGLTAKGTSSFFQPFGLYPITPKKSLMSILVNGKQIMSDSFSATHTNDLFYFDGGNARDASAPVVFAGYGIAADSLGYNDFRSLQQQNISIENKWVMILDDEPLQDEKTSLLPTYNQHRSPWSGGFFHKRLAFWNAGKPKGILIVTDLVPGHKDTFIKEAEAAAQNGLRIGQLSSFDTTPVVQTYCISSKMANMLLQKKGVTIEALQKQIDGSLKPVVFDIPKVVVNTEIEKAKTINTENILAFIEGRDPKLKDEVIIISSHYDHLGTNPLLHGDQIYNGAADNGSGTVACIAMANAFMQAKKQGFGPKRSILFINFSGEEKGLLGSMFFVNQQAIIDLNKVVAAINMDGIGGIDTASSVGTKNYVYIESKKGLSDELITIVNDMNAASKRETKLIDASGMGFNSDNKPFMNEQVPFIYFSTGRTEFYHQVKDEPNTIDYDQMATNVQLVFATAWQAANKDKSISNKRAQLKKAGFICNPCNLPCDGLHFDKPGICPVCGMWVVQGYEN